MIQTNTERGKVEIWDTASVCPFLSPYLVSLTFNQTNGHDGHFRSHSHDFTPCYTYTGSESIGNPPNYGKNKNRTTCLSLFNTQGMRKTLQNW